MITNGPEFDRALTVHAQGIVGKVEQFTEGVASALFNAIKERTPVATEGARAGRAKAGWQQVKVGELFEITNDVPYIVDLEEGWSQQAPEGMVKVTLLNAQLTVEEVAARVMTTP